MPPRPFRQGGLDSLCGLYAIINATRLAALPTKRLTENDCALLFKGLVSELAAERWLMRVLIDGSPYPILSRLLRVTDRWLRKNHDLQLRQHRPFRGKPGVFHQRCLKALAAHLKHPRTAAIIYLAEPWSDHWTVARAVSPGNLLLLFDSGRRRYARVRNRGSEAPNKQRRIVYQDLFLIRVEAHEPS